MGCCGSKKVEPNPIITPQISPPIKEQQEPKFQPAEELPPPNTENESPVIVESKEASIKIYGKRVQLPTITYCFDYDALLFYCYDLEENTWITNDLRQSTNNCPTNPLVAFQEIRTKQQAKETLANTSLIALSNEHIYMIGGYHPLYSNLTYNIKENRFTFNEKMTKNRNRILPNLCTVENYIYCVSGDEIDFYSTRFDRYDRQSDTWDELPDLPSAHGLGNSQCVIDHGNLKIFTIGGLASKMPRVYNLNISIFDFKTQRWEVTLLENCILKVPKFIRAPIVQDMLGLVLILGEERSYECFSFDFETNKFEARAKLARADDYNKPGFPGEAAYHDGYVVMPYKRNDLKSAGEKKVSLHRNTVSSDTWDII